MTDLREKIAKTIITEGQPGGVMIACRNANEVADAILAAIKDSIPPLVWRGSEEDCFVISESASHEYELVVVDTLERSPDYVWSAKATPHYNTNETVSLEVPAMASFTDAKAAANAHHVATLLAAMGMNHD